MFQDFLASLWKEERPFEKHKLSAWSHFCLPRALHFRRKSPNIRRDRLEGWLGHSGVLLANLQNIWAFAPQFMGPDHSGKILNAREEGPGPKKLVSFSRGKTPYTNWMPSKKEPKQKSSGFSLLLKHFQLKCCSLLVGWNMSLSLLQRSSSSEEHFIKMILLHH